MTRLLKRTAGDFGDSNIPSPFIKMAITPREPIALYWREIAEGNKTVEIWSTEETKYVIIEGDFSDGEWGQQDVRLVSEHEKLTDALEEVRTSYVFKDGGAESNEPVQQQDNPQQDNQEEKQAAAHKISRLKRQGS